LPLEQVQRVDLTAGGYRLVDLTQLPREVVDGGETFGFAKPPRLSAGDLMLHAPVRLAIALPEGAVRFAATAVLDLTGVPADRHDWASSQLTVQDAEQVPLAPAQQIDAAHPTARFNLPVSAGRLILDLDPSVNGPILDRVRLTDAVILLRRTAPPGY
jgi:hypothetical protein